MKTLALDIGGANLKAAHSSGGPWRARSVPFALWREPGDLARRLVELAHSGPRFERVLVTTTAELCDCFVTKRQGVLHVLGAVEIMAEGRPISIWGMTGSGGRLMTLEQVRADPLPCAAANWHALAAWLARRYPTGLSLLIDTGSTTTDIIPLQAGQPAAQGLTDTARLATGELVYSGAVRTSLASFGQEITWRGRKTGVMAETFATIGDVHLLLENLQEDPVRMDTADGRPMTRLAAAARMVRMIGGDLESLTVEDARELASLYDAAQQQQIVAAIRKVVAGRGVPDRIILAGSGDFVAARAAATVFPGIPTLRLTNELGPEISTAACAYALLQLAEVDP